MKSFLEYVAEDIIQKYGTNLSRIAIVFPNKRASLFLNEALARQVQRPIWSPAYITISNLFRQQSDLHVADPIQSVCLLHQSFCAMTRSTETLDKFYGWGQLLLSDFDDIDKNMADADRVLANLRDLHELDDISYLTDEQREMLQRFFSNFTEEHPSALKERFLHLWSRMADIYHDFRQRLASQSLAYEGMLYRQVAESLIANSNSDTADSTAFPYDTYLFVGFNLLQQVEQRLFALLQKEGKARFYWDFDHYYAASEAGQYISHYLKDFPNELDIERADIYDNFRQPKHVSFMSAPTENIQARYVSTWLQQEDRLKAGRRTAIVMCNEALLPTVIHSLPPQVEKVNVTTGYPLSQTPIASFIQLWFDIQMQGTTPRLMRTFRRHPYTKYIDDSIDTSDIIHLTSYIKTIAQKGNADHQSDPLFQESLFRAYTLINRLNDLIAEGVLKVTMNTLQRLVAQLIQQTSIPFHGEPAEGLQVMGVLETRNLDFDHVLLLSCAEGMLPRGINDSSFIPHSIRHAYELTTVENKVGIYSYYFHRLLQRASDVTILYNNSTDGGQRGEMSRFMLQLMVEYPHPIQHYSLTSGQQSVRWQPKPIAKSQISDFLAQTSYLSPTAINTWLRCPLRFFYRYVGGLQEPEVPDDELELDNRMFGTVFHRAADLLYHHLPQYVDKPILQHLLRNRQELERAVDEAFHLEMPHLPPSGLYIIQREVIVQYLRQLIALDLRQAPFRILGLEIDVFRPLSPIHQTSAIGPLKIGGRIDRLDLVDEGTANERIRIIDYKTGSSPLKPLPDVDAIFLPQNIHNHSDYYLQTLLYADIVRSDRPSSISQLPSDIAISPALIFIQHANADDYDPTLCFGRDRILDISPYSQHFNELLSQTITEILSPDVPFQPTTDLQVCVSCPFAPICRR
ncbi:MAG: PD-(D/E)XK nuclease family protein [Prevotella sp.]|nr:PD-(D/E)XK nuclease family protein [Prevotella sp.]